MTAMKALPLGVGTVHFVGIGGIGMSGIAELLHNLGYAVQGSDRSENGPEPGRRPGRGHLVCGQKRQSGGRRGAQAPTAGCPPRRDAGRADAAEMVDRGGRHPRQDDDDLAGRFAPRRRRPRPHGRQRRDHQRLGLQRQAGPGRLGGGRGRRVRRDVRQAAGHRRHRHQHRPRAPRPLRQLRGAARGLRHLRLQHPLLRLRRRLHRSSGSAADHPAAARPAGDHLRLQPAGGRSRCRDQRLDPRDRLRGRHHRPQERLGAHPGRAVPADVRPAQRAERVGGDRHRRRTRHRRRRRPQGVRGVRRGQPPLHQDGRSRWRHRHRRLRPSSGRDRRSPGRRPEHRPGAGDRRRPAAPLQPAARPVRGLLHLLQRRHGHRRVVRLPDAAALAGVVTGIATSGDLVVCLGAGSISQWAHALPGELEGLRPRASGGGR